MTNAEKYLKEGVSVEEIAEQIAITYFDRQSGGIQKAVKNFFESPITPTLTEDERVILRNLRWGNKKALKIGKDDKTGIYILFENDQQSGWFFNNFYGHLFQFIKNGEEYEIAELLKGE